MLACSWQCRDDIQLLLTAGDYAMLARISISILPYTVYIKITFSSVSITTYITVVGQ